MADAFFAAVDIAAVAEGEVLHGARQRHGAGPQHQMHMVRHQAVAVAAKAEAFRPLGQQFQEPRAVERIGEDRLPAIAPQHHMIDAAGDIDAGFAGHATRITPAGPIIQLCMTDPVINSIVSPEFLTGIPEYTG
jgi:hypothetical protein